MAAEKASFRKMYQEWLAQDAKENNGKNTIVAEELLSTLQVQGIIRQPDLYAVTKKSGNDAQNKELFVSILPEYGNFAFKKFVKYLQSLGKNALAEKLIALDVVRQENMKSGAPPPPPPEPEPEPQPQVVETVNPIEEANKTFHAPRGHFANEISAQRVNKEESRSFWEANKDKVYPNFVKPNQDSKGIALIISNEKFNVPWLKDRIGSEIDVKNISALLTNMGYKVDVHRNLVGQAMSFLMQYFALDQRHIEYDSVVVVLLTHGLPNGNLFGVDGEAIFVEDFVGYLSDRAAPNLAGKPKIFFIEACQSFASTDSNKKAMENFEANNSYANIPLKAKDVIIGYPRTPAYLSPKDVENGTWFIQIVCEVFSSNAKTMRIDEMFNEVKKRIEQERTADGPILSAEVCNCLKKQFLFFPGA